MSGIPKSKRGGGPKSAVGKEAASQNSLKTGAYSSMALLPGEDAAQYQALLDQFFSDFAPQHLVEQVLVLELVETFWKQLRLRRLEQATALSALKAPITVSEYEQSGFKVRPTARRLVDRAERSADVNLLTDLKNFHDAKPYLNRWITVTDLETMESQSPALYQHIVLEAFLASLIEIEEEPTSHEQLKGLMVQSANQGQVQFVRRVLTKVRADGEDLIWFWTKKSQILRLNVSIREGRMLALMQLDGPRRVHDDLSRRFARSLSELRKHQQWRRDGDTVDVTPRSTPDAK